MVDSSFLFFSLRLSLGSLYVLIGDLVFGFFLGEMLVRLT